MRPECHSEERSWPNVSSTVQRGALGVGVRRLKISSFICLSEIQTSKSCAAVRPAGLELLVPRSHRLVNTMAQEGFTCTQCLHAVTLASAVLLLVDHVTFKRLSSGLNAAETEVATRHGNCITQRRPMDKNSRNVEPEPHLHNKNEQKHWKTKEKVGRRFQRILVNQDWSCET